MEYTEVIQGKYGSCFFLSSVAACLLHKKESVTSIFKLSPDSAEAKFFLRSKFCWVTKKKSIKTDLTLAPESSKPDWVGLLEKCYGIFIGGVATYERGGYPWIVLYDLTGKEPDLYYSTSPDFRIKVLQAGNSAMVADSMGDDILNKYPTCRIAARHSYTVVSVDPESVTLRNPWGFFEPQGDNVNDGIFKLSWEDFTRFFIRVSSCTIK